MVCGLLPTTFFQSGVYEMVALRIEDLISERPHGSECCTDSLSKLKGSGSPPSRNFSGFVLFFFATAVRIGSSLGRLSCYYHCKGVKLTKRFANVNSIEMFASGTEHVWQRRDRVKCKGVCSKTIRGKLFLKTTDHLSSLVTINNNTTTPGTSLSLQ